MSSGAASGLPSHVVMLYVVKGNALITVGLAGLDDDAVAGQKRRASRKKFWRSCNPPALVIPGSTYGRQRQRSAIFGGANIAIKCPSHTYEQTVAFYRDTLGLPLIEEEDDGCIFPVWSEPSLDRQGAELESARHLAGTGNE